MNPLINKTSIFRLCMALFWTILIISGCQKESYFIYDTDVAINHEIIRVADTAGRTRVLVNAEAGWNAEMVDATQEWVKITSGSGNGSGQFFIEFDSNVGNLPRQTKIVVQGGDKKDTILFQQRGIPTTIAIKDTLLTGIAAGGKMKSGIVANIPFELMNVEIRYLNPESIDWISDVNIENGSSLVFSVAKTNESVDRIAILKLSYLDALGTLNQDSIKIKQKPKAGNDSDFAEGKDMAYVKSMLPNGIITENIFLEGVIISEKGNANLATNLNTAPGTVSTHENEVTFYLQDVNNHAGGILFKTKTSADNIFDQNERVKIWLKGTKLTKYSNPTRYVIEDVANEHILEKNEGDPVQPKEVYMKDLTDQDIYTWVKLKDVEMSIPNGYFSNMHEGYASRVSVYASSIRDINRNNMYMLINTAVPYRTSAKLPQGSGTITGILVHDDVPRFGGDIGKYSLRPLSREDIDLAENRENGFTRVIAEWSGYKTGDANPMLPDVGLEYGAKMSHSSKSILSGPDFNGPSVTSGGGYSVSGWWNAGKGESWIFELSTTGLTKPMSMQLEGGVIVGGPRNYVLEWSEDQDAGSWNLIDEYTLQDYVRAGSGTLYTQVAGYKVVDFALPLGLLNKPKIFIRARVKNNEAGTNTSDTGGTITSVASRLGHVSIKENK